MLLGSDRIKAAFVDLPGWAGGWRGHLGAVGEVREERDSQARQRENVYVSGRLRAGGDIISAPCRGAASY